MRGEHRVERVFAVLVFETCSVGVHIELFAVLIVGYELLEYDFRIFRRCLTHKFFYPVKQLVKLRLKNSGFVFRFRCEGRYLLRFVGNGGLSGGNALIRSLVNGFFGCLIYARDTLFAVFYCFHRDARVECGAHQAEFSAVHIKLILFAFGYNALRRVRSGLFKCFERVFGYLIYISHISVSSLSVRRY